MSVILLIAGVLVVLYGIFWPERKLPDRLRKSSGLGGSVIFGLLCVAGAALLSSPSDPDGEAEAVSVAGAFDEAPEAEAGWPGGDAARDSTLASLAALLAAERYPEAEDRARALATQPYAAPWTDSLRAIAQEAEERALFARAQRLPASAVRENWTAYTALAYRFPDSPRLDEYVAKRDAYERRLIEEQAERFAPPAPVVPAPEAEPPPVAAEVPAEASPPAECCRVCVRGKPCGNACIARDRVCRTEGGCACQG